MDDGAVGVELGGGVAGIIGELLDEVFVGVAQVILIYVLHAEWDRAEVIDERYQQVIGQALFVGPDGIAKDSVKTRVSFFDVVVALSRCRGLERGCGSSERWRE